MLISNRWPRRCYHACIEFQHLSGMSWALALEVSEQTLLLQICTFHGVHRREESEMAVATILDYSTVHIARRRWHVQGYAVVLGEYFRVVVSRAL